MKSIINTEKESTSTLDVSVVIPCFNSAKTIVRCLDSVAAQTTPPIEIIVVDDGSQDDIESIINAWRKCNKISLHYIRQENLGAAAARNAGIRLSKGRYVALLDSDDIWFPSKLEVQHYIMIKEKLKLSGHGYLFNLGEKNPDFISTSRRSYTFRKIKRWNFVYTNPLFTPTVMFDKFQFTCFDERFRRADDYKTWLENFQSDGYGYIDFVLASGFKRPIGQSGLTSSVYKMHRSYVDALTNLRAENTINDSFFYFALAIEYLKFPLRYFYSKLRTR